MTAPLDTNVLVRHFTGQPPGQARRATAFLDEAPSRSLFITDVHLSELVFVLESSSYSTPRPTVAAIIDSVLGHSAVIVENDARVRETVALYRDRTMDWADAYLVAAAISRNQEQVISFDRFDTKLRGLPVRRVEPSTADDH